MEQQRLGILALLSIESDLKLKTDKKLIDEFTIVKARKVVM